MKFFLFLIFFIPFFAYSGALSLAEDKIPKALIIEHIGDTYVESYEAPDGAVLPAEKRHKDDYSGTYIYEGNFNDFPYWVKNGCRGEFVVNECRCYIYYNKKSMTWVLVPQPPGTSGKLYGSDNDWLANAYNDSKWPWLGKWSNNIKRLTINNDIDLNRARKEAKINACPVEDEEKTPKKNNQEIRDPLATNKPLSPSSQKEGNNEFKNDLDLNADRRIGEELDTDNEYNASDKDRRVIAPDSEINIIREEQLAQKGKNDKPKLLTAIEVQNGGIYVGETKNGQPHGFGIIRFEERGIVYLGEWEQGVPNGEGIKYEKESDDFYFGEFKNAQKDGKGRPYFAESSINDVIDKMISIEFESKQDMKFWISNIKSAVASYTKLTKYSGTFKNNLMHGQGMLRYEDDSLYSGTFLQGFPNGQGKKNFANGDFYQGNFMDGDPSGNGILKSGDGSEYSGEFKKGLAHGKGQKRFPDRTLYTGEFKDGDANGKGTFTDKFKNKFTGLWKNGKLIKEEAPKK